MALQAIGRSEHDRLLKRLRLLERDNPDLALQQKQMLNSLFEKYNRLMEELDSTIGEYRKAAAPVRARVILKHKVKMEKA